MQVGDVGERHISVSDLSYSTEHACAGLVVVVVVAVARLSPAGGMLFGVSGLLLLLLLL